MAENTDIKNPPVSEKVLLTAFSKIINPLLKNTDITVIGFSGCGKSALVKYIIQNLQKINRENNCKVQLKIK